MSERDLVQPNVRIKRKGSRASAGEASKYLWVLIAFLFFEYVRFQDSYFPFLSVLSIPILLNLGLLFLVVPKIIYLAKDKVVRLVIFFLIQMAVLVPFSVNNFHAFNATFSMFLTVIVVLSMPVLIKDERSLRLVFRSLVWIIFLDAIWVMRTGGVGPGGFVYDENDICLLLVVGLPFVWFYSKSRSIKKIEKIFTMLVFIIAIIAIVLTSSRGGFLGLVAVLGMLLILSEKPLKNIVIASAFVAVVGGAAINLAPDDYVNDMKTITDKDNSTRNLRFLHWTTAWEVFKDNPVLGVGPQNYPWVSVNYFHLSPYYVEGARGRSGRQSHSLYFTLIPEMGFFGIFLFSTICLNFFKRLRSIRRENKVSSACEGDKSESLFLFSSALTVSMVGFVVASAFVSVLYYPIFWNLVGLMVAVWCVQLTRNK